MITKVKYWDQVTSFVKIEKNTSQEKALGFNVSSILLWKRAETATRRRC